MKSKALEVTLGILTSIGGFVEAGSIATAIQAGAAFGYQLLWALLLGTICLVFLIEMSGRLAAMSHRTITDAVRERFGFNFSSVPRAMELIVNFLVLGAELGGCAIGISIVTGWDIRLIVLPVAIALWFMLWRGTLSVIENATSILGLVALCTIVGMVRMHPAWHEVARGFAPSLPAKERANYWFLAISIIGATISPYMFSFYSSGAVEDEWDESYLTINRVTSGLGMAFGATVSVAFVGCAALSFLPRGIKLDDYHQAGLLLLPVFGKWGVRLTAASIAICCFGAAVELSLGSAYTTAQTFGWNWGANQRPKDNARFVLTYTVFIFASALLIVAGLDPLKLTMFTMALTAVVLPAFVIPFLLLMNDKNYVGEHRNGWIGNSVVVLTIILASILAVVTIPLQIAAGGG